MISQGGNTNVSSQCPMYSAAKYLVVQVVVQVVAHEEVEQGLLAVLVMLQHGCAGGGPAIGCTTQQGILLLLSRSIPLEN